LTISNPTGAGAGSDLGRTGCDQRVTLIKIAHTPLDLTNPAGNLAGAGFGQNSEKWLDFGFAGAAAEIRYRTTLTTILEYMNSSSSIVLVYYYYYCCCCRY